MSEVKKVVEGNDCKGDCKGDNHLDSSKDNTRIDTRHLPNGDRVACSINAVDYIPIGTTVLIKLEFTFKEMLLANTIKHLLEELQKGDSINTVVGYGELTRYVNIGDLVVSNNNDAMRLKVKSNTRSLKALKDAFDNKPVEERTKIANNTVTANEYIVLDEYSIVAIKK